jgi:exo-poly-alpha-galacturonosidase
LATDDSKTLLVWNKPDLYDDVVDYRVYMNGVAIGTAEENARMHSPAQEYVDAFRQPILPAFMPGLLPTTTR